MLIFLSDALVVAWTAWVGVCVAGLDRRGLVEGLLGWGLLALAWVAASGELLGLGGGLGRGRFLAVHLVALAGLLLARRQWRDDLGRGRAWLADWGRLMRSGTPVGVITAGLAVTLLLLAGLAAMGEPIVFDALTYRLSRIGAWLQDGWIRHYATDDPRINYMPHAPDVVIAWLVGASVEGFPLASLSQVAGGVLLLGATFGLARTVGLTRLAAFGAVVIVLGMGNAAAQFTSLHSDLFTAGAFAAAYLLWHRAWQRGHGSWVAGVGVALAFGSKGTMFYLAPGAAIWCGWLVWSRRHQWRALMPTAAGVVAAALVLVLPGYWQNLGTYGSPFGPPEAVVLHHGSFNSPAQHAEKLARNLGTSAVQLFEPTAQPLWLQELSRSAGLRLAARLPGEADPYVFIGLPRRAQVTQVLRLPLPDADVITCGLLAVGLFVAGGLLAVARPRRPGASQILIWIAGTAGYLLVQHGLVQWHHWAFRFMVLVAPWVAVVGAWGLAALSRKLQIAAWAVVIVSALQVFVMIQLRTGQSGWMAAMQPARSASYYFYNHWRVWAGNLDQPGEPLRLAFPINRALSAFHRLEPLRPVTFLRLSELTARTAEEAVGGDPGWLLVPQERFIGQEGRVMGRIGPFDLAAYRALRPGEQPRPLLYVNNLLDQGGTLRRELLLRTWPDVPVQLELFNPSGAGIPFTLRTPGAEIRDTLAAGVRRVWVVPVPADTLAIATIDFAKGSVPDFTTTAIMVRLVP